MDLTKAKNGRDGANGYRANIAYLPIAGIDYYTSVVQYQWAVQRRGPLLQDRRDAVKRSTRCDNKVRGSQQTAVGQVSYVDEHSLVATLDECAVDVQREKPYLGKTTQCSY